MAQKRHRCRKCGREFSTGLQLREHIARRHPRETEVRWWMAVEDPSDFRFEV
jgi:hypothetical protein